MKTQAAEPTFGASDSAGLGGAQESAFLMSSQVILRLVVCHHTLRTADLQHHKGGT